MKKYLNSALIVLFISLSLLSCDDNDINSSEDTARFSMSSSGEVTTEFDSTLLSQIDSIELTIEDTSNGGGKIVSSAKVNETDLTFTLDNVEDKDLNSIYETLLEDDFSGTVSDEDALVSNGDGVFVEGFKNKVSKGYLWLSNTADIFADVPRIGDATCILIYCNKSVTIKGEESDSDDEFSITWNFDITLNKGWNQLIYTASSSSETKVVWNITANTTLTSGMKWILRTDD